MAKTLSIKTGKGIEIGSEKEVKAKLGNGIDFGNDNEIVAKGNTQKGIDVSEDGIEVKVDNETAKLNANGEIEVVATKPDISAGGGIKLETPTGEITTEISVKTDNITTRINTNGQVEAIGTKPDIEAGAGIELETATGGTTTTISVKTDNTTINKNASGELEVIEQDPKITQGNGIIVNIDGEHTAQVRAKGGNGIDVNANGINVKTDNITTRINSSGQVEAIGTKPDIEAGAGIELETPTGETTTTIKAKASNGIVVDANGISANINTDTLEFDTNGKINVKEKAPDIESGNGINIATSGNTKTISANINTDTLEFDSNGKINVIDKADIIAGGNGILITTSLDSTGKATKTISARAGNGIGVGSSGISANVGNGLHISSNKIGINANFTEIDTPLGTGASNIKLHSDGKISVENGGGGGAFLYATLSVNTIKDKFVASGWTGTIPVNQNINKTIDIMPSDFVISKEITNYNNYIYIFVNNNTEIYRPTTWGIDKLLLAKSGLRIKQYYNTNQYNDMRIITNEANENSDKNNINYIPNGNFDNKSELLRIRISYEYIPIKIDTTTINITLTHQIKSDILVYAIPKQ